MGHPLTNVYLAERCHVYGNTYPVTLYDVFREQQLAEQWQSVRPCDECDEHRQRLVAAVPAPELAAVMAAWERLVTALQARDLAFTVNSPAVASGVSQREPGRHGR
jgi:hypothetical protein